MNPIKGDKKSLEIIKKNLLLHMLEPYNLVKLDE